MKFAWKNWNIGGKIIFVSACVSTLSMLMKWVDVSILLQPGLSLEKLEEIKNAGQEYFTVDLGIVSQSGLSQETFLLLGLYVYPVLMLFKNKSIHKVWGLVCSIASVVFTLYYISSKSVELFGETVNVSGNGAWLFLLSSITLIVGVLKYFSQKQDKDKHDVEQGVEGGLVVNNKYLYNRRKVINKQDETVDLTQVITDFCNSYSGKESKNIWYGDEIPSEYIEKHKKVYLNMSSDEKPLVLLNKGAMIGNVFTGLVITNSCIHFCTLKKSFFTGILPWFFKGEKGKENINGLKSLEIAEHDTCFGYAYVGHELRINGEILGYVRMGTGILLDDKAIKFLNTLFNHFTENGILERKVNNYNWQ